MRITRRAEIERERNKKRKNVVLLREAAKEADHRRVQEEFEFLQHAADRRGEEAEQHKFVGDRFQLLVGEGANSKGDPAGESREDAEEEAEAAAEEGCFDTQEEVEASQEERRREN